MSAGGDFDILVVGLNDSLWELISPILGRLRPKRISTSSDLDSFLENFQLAAGSLVLISTTIDGMTHFEVGQALSSYYQGLHLVFVTLDQSKFEYEKLKKNGFTDSFLLPLDRKLMVKLLEDSQANRAGGGSKKFKAVKLVDVQPGQELPFEVRTFLPLNNKYVVLTGSGKISDKKHELLKSKNVNSIFIDSEQIEKFYEFAADQLISLGKSSNDSVSETEKSERLQNTVRDLFRSILDAGKGSGDFEGGRDLFDQSKKIVENYVQKKNGIDLKARLKDLMGEGDDSYSHAQAVSTIACLLSMATGIGQPEDLAIAGLFHDIGIQGLKWDVSIFEFENLTDEEKKEYSLHCKRSLNLLKEKRVTLTPLIAEIIEKHHERLDGKGFPAQLSGHRVPPEAQLLAYADAFEYLTRTRPGQPNLEPEQIHSQIGEKLSISPEILKKIEKFLKSA